MWSSALVGGATQKRSFPVLKHGSYLVSAIQPIFQEETARYRAGVPDYTGEDVIIVRDEKIAALYVFLDAPPA